MRYTTRPCFFDFSDALLSEGTEEGYDKQIFFLILRGALNYPLEEACYREHIRVHDISFLSSERVFEKEEIAGLEIKYSKLTMVPDSTLMIGDIIASGETLIHCLRYVTDFYRDHGARLRNIIIFTIGGTKGIDILEKLLQRSVNSGRSSKALLLFIMKESSVPIRTRVFPGSTSGRGFLLEGWYCCA